MILFSFRAFEEGAEQLKKPHRIPCYKCDFFTNDYHLKCTVHPSFACSEQALGCIDFEPKTANKNNSSHKWGKYSLPRVCETQLQNYS